MTLKIEVGKYYRTRDGRKVGPMRLTNDTGHFMWVGPSDGIGRYSDAGIDGNQPDGEWPTDLIAEWTDEPDAAPDYNDGSWWGWNGGECPVHPETVVELLWPSMIDENKSLRSTRKADGFNWFVSKISPAFVFRVVKPYTAPREWWIVGGCEAYDSEADAFDACKSLVGSPTPVHVREVKE